ncbi:MAG TPA: hypothetical protein VIG93_00265 [Gaiellaceae bacterium]
MEEFGFTKVFDYAPQRGGLVRTSISVRKGGVAHGPAYMGVTPLALFNFST